MTARHAKTDSAWLDIGYGDSYFDRTHRPLQCLLVILPLLAIYQIGSMLHPWTPGHGDTPNVIAFAKMLELAQRLFGHIGLYMPLALVVACLLGAHFFRKDKWALEPKLWLAMYAESILWAIPILIFGLLASSGAPLAGLQSKAVTMSSFPWQTQVVLAVGAGVYEELVFRLILIAALDFILLDLLRWSKAVAIPVIILTSAVLFSLYHYLGAEQPSWGTFIFRTLAGVYLAAIYIFRGFGIDVCTHTAYDLMAVVLGFLSGHH